MKLRTHLLLLVLGTLLPMVAFGTAATALIAHREKAVFQRGATERTLALVTAVDTELASHATSLLVLASSIHLETGNLPAFHEEAKRILAGQESWERINLALTSGQRVLDTEFPFGAPLPSIVDRASLERAVTEVAPVIGDLFEEAGTHRFAARVPIVRGVDVRYVLSAHVDPKVIAGLLTLQGLPGGWVGVVLDENHRIVARTLNYSGTLGALASRSLRRALERAPKGWFQGTTLEGRSVYTPYSRSTASGWTVALGIPESAVEASASTTAWILAGGVLTAVLIAGFLATALGARITAPITALAAMARAIEEDGPVAPPPSKVREVRDVSRALADAADAVRDRERALLAADRAKDEFLAVLAHELRNPLAPIRSALEVIRMTSGADVAESVAMMERQVDHMVRLVDDLLDISRLSLGKIELRTTTVSMQGVVEQGVEATRSASEQKGVELSVALPDDACYVRGDPTRLVQVVENLVNNACKFTPPGGSIRVDLAIEEGQAVLRVADTGIGIAEDQLERIFEIFTQVDATMERAQTGLGIGLTLTRNLVVMHGGTVDARSAGLGRGSEFFVRLPLVAEPPRDAERVDGSAARNAPANSTRVVLIVDDNRDAARSLALLLELTGHEIHVAYDGMEAFEVAERERPDVALMDIGMPGLNGYETARKIRSQPWGRSIALVAVTGWGTAEDRRRTRAAGFDAHMTKPIEYDELVDFLEKHPVAADGRPHSP